MKNLENNTQVALELMNEALERKTKSGSERPQSIRRIISKAEHTRAYRRQKLEEFRTYLDDYEARPVESLERQEAENTLRCGLENIHGCGVKSPDDRAMYLLHEQEMEQRGLEHLLPQTDVDFKSKGFFI